MISILLLAVFIGIMFCAINRWFRPSQVISVMILAFLGAVEGKILAEFIQSDVITTVPMMTSLLVLFSSLAFVFIRKISPR